ncbi:MAG: ornithine--oxo-acid transaminase [Pseudomonadota bacterium]|jgi:ornithine--oxo-acid transaminase
MNSREIIELTEKYSANNYAPLDVVLKKGQGVWVEDVDGNRYMDFLSAYSSMNFGHCNPRIVQAAHRQLDALTIVSRAFYAENVGLLCKELSELTGKDKVLLMNTGAEAVETAIKGSRKWGYEVKGVPQGKAEIIVFDGNFHGRTTTIVGFSSSELSYRNFGPFAPGFVRVPYGDAHAVESAITPNTVAVLVEPILGEGGVIIPPHGFLKSIRELCTKNNVIMIADEIWTSLGRTGKIFACDHEDVVPDMYLMAKSLGGGIVAISAVIANSDIMKVFTPGSHGSTLGGNPFACAIAREVLALVREEQPDKRSAELGTYMLERLRAMNSRYIKAVRGRGLMIGIDIDPAAGTAKDFCKKLKKEGVLCKDTHVQTIRMAPPLVISRTDLDWGLERVERVFAG